MVVWGGFNGAYLATGGVYSPATNTWATIATTGAPGARSGFPSIWTGSRFLVWGGEGPAGQGAAFNPGTNAWTSITTTGEPAARSLHSAVWTGAKMIVWGGQDAPSSVTSTGSVYQ